MAILGGVTTLWNQLSVGTKVFIALVAVAPAIYLFGFLEAALVNKILALAVGYVLALAVGWVSWKMNTNPIATGAFGLIAVGVAALFVLVYAGFLGRATHRLPPSARSISRAALMDAGAFDSLKEFAAKIPFDTLTHGQTDYNILDSAIGTMGLIVPAPRLHNTERSKLREGRILWRVTITNDSAHSGWGYKPLNLPDGVSWILVYNYKDADSAALAQYYTDTTYTNHQHGDPKGTKIVGFADALIIPESDSVREMPRKVAVKQHLGYWWNRPLARFAGPGDHHLWGNCGSHGCCES